jgi:uncharacterized protein YbaR (Trm112 family)
MKIGWVGAVAGLAAVGAVVAARKLFATEDDGGAFAVGGPVGARREGLDPTLLEILACPDDKQPVIYQREGDAERLTCTSCGKRYPVRDGIPVMLFDEASVGPLPTADEVAAAVAMRPEGKPAIVGQASVAPSHPTNSVASVTSTGEVATST